MTATVRIRRRVAVCLSLLLPSTAFPATQYWIDPAASELRVLVYRAGLFSGLGHNHVVTSHALSGIAVLGDSPATSAVTVELPVTSLTVDAAEARAEEGPDFPAQVEADAIEATRRNMLGPRLLDAENYDVIRIESTGIDGAFPNVSMRLRITVKGEPHALSAPVSVNTIDGGLVAVGRLRMRHTDLGLRPFEAALGSLRVADEMLVKFRIFARAESR